MAVVQTRRFLPIAQAGALEPVPYTIKDPGAADSNGVSTAFLRRFYGSSVGKTLSKRDAG